MTSTTLGFLRSRRVGPTEILLKRGEVSDGRILTRLLGDYLRSRHVLIADQHVYRHHGEQLVARLRSRRIDLAICLVPVGEASKSTTGYLRLVESVLAAGVDKGSNIITLGGGVTNNLGGFVAATVYRGLPLIHLPSSLLAQLDAAIDIRQAINHHLGKNLIGAHYAPRAVLIDPALLATLPLRQLRSGMAEAVKHSLTQNRAFFLYLRENAHRLSTATFVERVVRQTIASKLTLLNRVSLDHAEARLQYGHCIGHAIETASHYTLLHGEAIAIGMAVSAQIAVTLGLCHRGLLGEHESILRAYQLPVKLPRNSSIATILEGMGRDKNVRRGALRMALLRSVGRLHNAGSGPFISVGSEVVREILETRLEGREEGSQA